MRQQQQQQHPGVGGQRGINHTPRKPQAESRQSKAILSCIFMAKQGAATEAI